jgi:VIT1/CCC1 family predicted Fe2+/Mn2+ transporter
MGNFPDATQRIIEKSRQHAIDQAKKLEKDHELKKISTDETKNATDSIVLPPSEPIFVPKQKIEIAHKELLPASIRISDIPDSEKTMKMKEDKLKTIQNIQKKSIKKPLPLQINHIHAPSNRSEKKERENEEEHEKMSLFERANEFASGIAAMVDGLSPFMGVLVVIIPFFIPSYHDAANYFHFFASFFGSLGVLYLLGSYLGQISQNSKIRLGLTMVGAAIITSLISFGLNSLAVI